MSIGLPRPSSFPELPSPEKAFEEKIEQAEVKEEKIEPVKAEDDLLMPTADAILINHEERLRNVESILLRIRGAI